MEKTEGIVNMILDYRKFSEKAHMITENGILFSEFDLEYNGICMVNKCTCNNSERYPGVEC